MAWSINLNTVRDRDLLSLIADMELAADTENLIYEELCAERDRRGLPADEPANDS